MEKLSPNASSPVRINLNGVLTFVALHQSESELWLYEFNTNTGQWVSVRPASDDDIEIIAQQEKLQEMKMMQFGHLLNPNAV